MNCTITTERILDQDVPFIILHYDVEDILRKKGYFQFPALLQVATARLL
jgi:hypothetical protein